jgi:UDP-glucose 4-epimerase
MSHYLITGGAGFIGSSLAERLSCDGHQVTIVDDLSSGSRTNLEHLHGSVSLIEKDMNSFGGLSDLVAEADVVFHLAASVGVFTIIADPVRTITNNIDGAEAILAAAARHRTRVILTSTSEVYGKSTAVPFREDADLLLGPTSKSRWSYAASKIVDEFLAQAYWQEKDVPATVVRLFNTIGPRQVGRYGMVVPRFIQQALDGDNLTVYGTGRQTRCFCDVADIVEWLIRLADNSDAAGEVVNLGNPEEISILDLAHQVISVTGSPSGIEFVPTAEAYGAGFEDVERRVPDISKAVRLTGYAPTIKLPETLARISDWFRTRRPGESTDGEGRWAVCAHPEPDTARSKP